MEKVCIYYQYIKGEIMTIYQFQANIDQFKPDAIRYHGENALLLTDCAKLAYMPKEIIQEAIQKQWKCKNFDFVSGKSTQAFIAGNEAFIIIAFRGTEGKIEDFIADARVIQTSGPVGKVHRGFNAALHEVWGDQAISRDIRSIINEFQDNNQTIWFCGHSLGAALATLAVAEYLLLDEGKINGLYTIGQPRVGDKEFATRFDAAIENRCFRFVNNNDVVTRIPLPGKIMQYTHVGNLLYIDSNGNLLDAIPWWKKLWDRIKGIAGDVGSKGLDALDDHSSADYVRLLLNNRSVTTRWS